MRHRFLALLFAVAGAGLVVAGQVPANLDPALLGEMKWRSIGPFRGGRTKAVAGIPSQPHVFYIGVVNGGVWKTTDAGRTWVPIFDDQPTGSIGAIAIAPSDPRIIYVGSGEGMQRPDLSTGDGIYKSTDGGRTWSHLGLRDGQQIPHLVVDPRDFSHVVTDPVLARRQRQVLGRLLLVAAQVGVDAQVGAEQLVHGWLGLDRCFGSVVVSPKSSNAGLNAGLDRRGGHGPQD